MVKLGYGGFEMQKPHHEKLEDGAEDPSPNRVGGLMPKYHLVDGLSSKKMAGWIDSALPLAIKLEDLLPERVRESHHLLPIADAVRLGHSPDTLEQWRDARRRMAFAELFELQAAFALMRASIAAAPATPIPYRQEVIHTLKGDPGFDLTRSQRPSTPYPFPAIYTTHPPHPLLNGAVGSGKTAVPAACVA